MIYMTGFFNDINIISFFYNRAAQPTWDFVIKIIDRISFFKVEQ